MEDGVLVAGSVCLSPYTRTQNGQIGESTKQLLEEAALRPLTAFVDVGWSLVGLLGT